MDGYGIASFYSADVGGVGTSSDIDGIDVAFGGRGNVKQACETGGVDICHNAGSVDVSRPVKRQQVIVQQDIRIDIDCIASFRSGDSRIARTCLDVDRRESGVLLGRHVERAGQP